MTGMRRSLEPGIALAVRQRATGSDFPKSTRDAGEALLFDRNLLFLPAVIDRAVVELIRVFDCP